MYVVNAKSKYILRSVPVVLGDPQRCRPPSAKKTCLDRVHAPLKRQRVLQRMLTEGHAGLLVDTGQQVLDSLFRSRAGKGPSSHMGQHFSAAIIVRNGHPEIVDSRRCHTDQNRCIMPASASSQMAWATMTTMRPDNQFCNH